MIDPDLSRVVDRLLDLARQNIDCARVALTRGNASAAFLNIQGAYSLIVSAERRLSAPFPSGPITAPDNSSIQTTNPTPEKAEAKTAPTLREGTSAGV